MDRAGADLRHYSVVTGAGGMFRGRFARQRHRSGAGRQSGHNRHAADRRGLRDLDRAQNCWRRDHYRGADATAVIAPTVAATTGLSNSTAVFWSSPSPAGRPCLRTISTIPVSGWWVVLNMDEKPPQDLDGYGTLLGSIGFGFPSDRLVAAMISVVQHIVVMGVFRPANHHRHRAGQPGLGYPKEDAFHPPGQ